MSKKVACCIDAWFPLQGGAQYHVAEVYKELSRNSAGYDWHILTRAIRGSTFSPAPALRFGWASSFENPLMRFYYVFRLFVHLLLKGRFYQIYHAQDASSAVAIQMASFFTGIPTVLTVHGTTLFSPAKSFLGRAKKVLEKLIFLKFRYDALLSVSRNLQEARGAKTPVSLLRNGVRMERFGPRSGGENSSPYRAAPGVRLLFVGRLETIKGLSVLFKALEGLGNSVQLCVVGDGGLRQSLEKEAMEKKLPVVFLGALEGEKLAGIYGESEVFVLPSLSEGFPLTLLEACAAGLAIVATRTGDVSTLVHEKKNGLLVNAGAVEELTEALRSFVKDCSLAKQMGEYGREKVATLFTWKQSAATIEKAYEQALWHEKPQWLSRLRSIWKDPRMPWRLGRIRREKEVKRADAQVLHVAFTVDVEQEGGSGLKNGGVGERTKHLPRFFREFSERMTPLKIPATLFVQGELIPDFRQELLAAQAAGNELGIHGYAHELWGQRPWFVKDPWQNPAHRFFYLKTIRDELRSAGLEKVRAFRAPNMVSDATTEKLLVHFGFSLDSSGAVQLGQAPLPGTRVSGKLTSLPVSRDPQPTIKWIHGLPFGHYGVMNMAHFATWTEGELLAVVERLYAYHRAHGLQPHFVFLAHSWDILPHWELLEKRLKLLQSKYSIKFLTLSALNDS